MRSIVFIDKRSKWKTKCCFANNFHFLVNILHSSFLSLVIIVSELGCCYSCLSLNVVSMSYGISSLAYATQTRQQPTTCVNRFHFPLFSQTKKKKKTLMDMNSRAPNVAAGKHTACVYRSDQQILHIILWTNMIPLFCCLQHRKEFHVPWNMHTLQRRCNLLGRPGTWQKGSNSFRHSCLPYRTNMRRQTVHRVTKSRVSRDGRRVMNMVWENIVRA